MKYKSTAYIEQFKRSMEKDIYKAIGHKPIKEFTSGDILGTVQFDYISIYYNRVRRHSANGWLSPEAKPLNRNISKI
jgi:transposase InsO family protein